MQTLLLINVILQSETNVHKFILIEIIRIIICIFLTNNYDDSTFMTCSYIGREKCMSEKYQLLWDRAKFSDIIK